MDLSALLQSMTQQTGDPGSPLFGPTMPFAQQPPPPMPPMPQAMPQGPDPGAEAPMGPPPQNPLGMQPVAHDWKAQLPQLLMAIAGLAGAGNNPYGAAAYMRGFQQTKQDEEDRALEAQKQAAITERYRREDAIRQQATDRFQREDDLKREQFIATQTEAIANKLAGMDTPEEREAYLNSIKGPMSRLGINMDDIAKMPLPGTNKKLQGEAAAAVEAWMKSAKEQQGDLGDPALLDGASVLIRGKRMSIRDAADLGGVPLLGAGAPRVIKPKDDFQSYVDLARKAAMTGGHTLSDAEELHIYEAAKTKWEAMGRKVPTDDTASSPAVSSGLTGQALLKTLDATTAAKVKAIAEGRVAFPARIGKGDKYWQNLLDLVVLYDPSFEASDFNKRAKLRVNYASSGSGMVSVNAINTAIAHMKKLSDSVESLNNWSLQPINKAKNYLAEKAGYQDVPVFKLNANALADEFVRLYRGAGGTGEEVKNWRESFSEVQSPGQLHGVIERGAELMLGKLAEHERQYSQGMNVGPVSMISPGARKVLQELEQRAGKPGANMPDPAAMPVGPWAGHDTPKIDISAAGAVPAPGKVTISQDPDGTFSVTAPNGKVYSGKTRAQAEAFKAKAEAP